MKISVIAFIGLMANVVSGLELTADNYEFETHGKTVFIKFYAPWCGHCKKMKPDWDKLMDAFQDKDTQLVAEVDCTSDGGKPLCDANGVRGYPTLKWGDPADLQDYSGQRSYDALNKFAAEELHPMCSPNNIDLCDDAKKADIQKFMDMDAEALDSFIAGKEKEISDSEEEFKTFVEKLQSQYKEAMEKKDAAADAIKEAGLGLAKAVKIAKKKKSHDEL